MDEPISWNEQAGRYAGYSDQIKGLETDLKSIKDKIAKAQKDVEDLKELKKDPEKLRKSGKTLDQVETELADKEYELGIIKTEDPKKLQAKIESIKKEIKKQLDDLENKCPELKMHITKARIDQASERITTFEQIAQLAEGFEKAFESIEKEAFEADGTTRKPEKVLYDKYFALIDYDKIEPKEITDFVKTVQGIKGFEKVDETTIKALIEESRKHVVKRHGDPDAALTITATKDKATKFKDDWVAKKKELGKDYVEIADAETAELHYTKMAIQKYFNNPSNAIAKKPTNAWEKFKALFTYKKEKDQFKENEKNYYKYMSALETPEARRTSDDIKILNEYKKLFEELKAKVADDIKDLKEKNKIVTTTERDEFLKGLKGKPEEFVKNITETAKTQDREDVER